MKAATTNMNLHILQEVTTLAWLWEVTRMDGVIHRWTTHDRNLVFGGNTYAAGIGFVYSAQRQSDSLDVDNTAFEGYLDSLSISEDDVRAGKLNFATVVVQLVNWEDLTMGSILVPGHRLGELNLEDDKWKTELRGMAQDLTRSVGDVSSPLCRADLGDDRCQFDVETLRQTGSIVGTDGYRTLVVSGITGADTVFTGGLLSFTSGNMNSLSVEVKSWVTGTNTLTLYLKTLMEVVIGDTFTIIPGCDKTKVTCHDIFDNVINMQAEPHAQGNDFLQNYPDFKSPTSTQS